ncbi:MAG: hypothetical protein LQ351_000062 [Letrouitia transgressa]|nr:MAG: hypothetical protein LQ351_000062 [Letrouitia transgressa]
MATPGAESSVVDESSVFRVSPNELSFASVSSWKAIYGHAIAGKPTAVKSKFYEMYGAGFNSWCIGSERDPKVHGRMKKLLSHAFSTKALIEQEDIIQKSIDAFIEKIGPESQSPKGLNVGEWYQMVAFDILGDMAFGESFHCIENGISPSTEEAKQTETWKLIQIKGKPHFWPELILEHLFFITVVDNLRRYPLFVTLGKWLLPKFTVATRNKHSGYARNQVSTRLAHPSERKDFLSNIIDKVEAGEVSHEELTAHTSTLVIAGGETVSTFLPAVTYYLLTNPEPYRKLREEIRSTYTSLDQIDASSAQRLPYLQAVIQEGLRIYPPGSQGFPRISPGMMVDDHFVPEGSEMYTSAWTTTHNSEYFHEPFSFKPERWIDPDCKDVKEASNPFSLGPRGCLGRNFAELEMSLILAKLNFKYDLEMVNKGLDWERESHMHVMWWKPELRVRFIAREKA